MNLLDALRAEGGPLADALVAEPALERGPARLALDGPRVRKRAGEYELLLEIIFEGSLLHYGSARLVQTQDRDLALLLGDQLYAVGLSRLAAIGDLEAVAELADVIALIAQAHAAGEDELADAIWEAGAVAIGWGASDAHVEAKSAARAGDPRAAELLRAAAAAAQS